MSQVYALSDTKAQQLVHDAVSRRLPVVLSCHTSTGWFAFKSHWLGIDRDTGRLWLAQPWGEPAPEIVPNEQVGITFRHGQRKCVFDTIVLRRGHFDLDKKNRVPALLLEWPSETYEFQRRVYYRVPIPDRITIPVNIWPLSNTTSPTIWRGKLVDLSAGGLSVTLPPRHPISLAENHNAGCAFSTSRGDKPVEVEARLRHRETLANGSLLLGFQFLALETTAAGRQSLESIIAFTNYLRHVDYNRRR